jgi:phenylalanyl-tRNA synthetase beta chain
MKFNLEWLQKFIAIQDKSADLAAKITDAGLEVESFANDLFDVSIPPNRADCLGMVGLAREVSAITRIEFKEPEIKPVANKISDQINVEVTASEACPKYLARVIKNIDNTRETPQWIKDCLVAAEIKLISPVVDITNYVLLEWGQPLHAFDLRKLDGNLEIRFAKAGEELILLDESHVKLTTETLVIADSKKPLAIAGVKGGKDSGIANDTRDILIECAYFEPVGVRLTSRHFGLKTDGSYRFERCIDSTMQEKVMDHVTQLVLDTVGGEPGPVTMVSAPNYLPKPVTISLRHARIAKILGIDLTLDQASAILQRLGMQVQTQGDNLTVNVPGFRADITREIDLIEEIARIYGYQNIPAVSTVGTLEFRPLPEARLSEQQILTCLANRGYQEAITYSFIDAEYAKALNIIVNPELCLANPISSEMGFMRPSLLPGLLKTLQYNENRQQARIRLFEVGLRYLENHGDLQQIKTIAGICSGNQLPENWASAKRSVDLFDLTGDVLALFELSGNAGNVSFQPAYDLAMHPGQCVAVYLHDKQVGKIGAIHPSLQQTLALAYTAFMFELDYDSVANGKVASFQMFAKFPSVRRDLAIVVAENITSDKLEQAIRKQAGEALTDLVLFDVYQGKGVPEKHKSMGYGITLQLLDRTLTDNEVNEIFTNLISMLQREFNATLR